MQVRSWKILAGVLAILLVVTVILFFNERNNKLENVQEKISGVEDSTQQTEELEKEIEEKDKEIGELEKDVDNDGTNKEELRDLKYKYLSKFEEFDEYADNLLLEYNGDSEADRRNAVEIGAIQWDTYMNLVYQILQSNLSVDEFSSLKEEQTDWLEELDEELEDDSYSMEESGTAGKEMRSKFMYDAKRERSYELLEEYF